LSWSHNILLLNKIKNKDISTWYAEQSIENGWSLNTLEHQIEIKLYERQVIADKTSNYKHLLESPFSDKAIETLKDPYVFDFIQRRDGVLEREIENEMVASIAKTILELGTGFAFVGNQYHIEIGDKDYYIDLLFYNIKLRCYVVIEIKNTEFKPEYTGKLNFYLTAINEKLKHEADNPSIGIVLCKTKDKLVAEYALKDINKPIGVSEYKLSEYLLTELADTLPSAEDIEKRVKLQFDVNEDK
jgi:predicted nuclease of restriction endonuclease-like (RecB) superfamily